MSEIYRELQFPDVPKDRPYTYINMVATIDGKTVTGSREEPVQDLGSTTDHELMRRIEEASDAILIGAGNLRATPKLWYPASKIRIVATRGGDLDYGCRFFAEAMDKAMVIAPSEVAVPKELVHLTNDFRAAFRELRHSFGVKRLLVEGGSELNAELLRANLIDELFLTLSPKIKLGRDVPTYAGGEALARSDVQDYELLDHRVVGNELFLRYRRKD